MAAKLRLTPAEGFLGVLVGVIRADGKERREEFDVVLRRLDRLEDSLGIRPLDFAQAMERLASMAREIGRDRFVVECVRALPVDLRLTAFETAVDIVAADREVTPEEIAHLHLLSRKLQIPKTVTDAVLRTKVARA